MCICPIRTINFASHGGVELIHEIGTALICPNTHSCEIIGKWVDRRIEFITGHLGQGKIDSDKITLKRSNNTYKLQSLPPVLSWAYFYTLPAAWLEAIVRAITFWYTKSISMILITKIWKWAYLNTGRRKHIVVSEIIGSWACDSAQGSTRWVISKLTWTSWTVVNYTISISIRGIRISPITTWANLNAC